MEKKMADKITRTITTRTIYYAFLTDELEVKRDKTVVFGASPANIPEGAKIISTSTHTYKCSMSLEKFFELCEKDVIVK